MPRRVTLVLVRADGSVAGRLAPFPVEPPWWSEAASIVEAARARHGVDVAVLRLLHADPDPDDPWHMGGDAVYAAELTGAAPSGLLPVGDRELDALDDDPLRRAYARPGGPARELAWAGTALAAHGVEPSGPPQQMRTWNLSSIWSIPTTRGPVWLKSVPPFFAHEGRVIEWLADRVLPPLLAAAEGRVLLADIPGVDHYDAELTTLERAVGALVGIQDRVADRIDELLALGLPDWRWPALTPLIDDVVARHRHELEPAPARAVDRLRAELEARGAAVDACGLPQSLVHGDFHPGNLRGDGNRLALLDWGDCGIGHPLLDAAAMFHRRGPERSETGEAHPLLVTWARHWRERRPGSDPLRAAALLQPIAALRQAVIYRGFLDAIEPSERCYHAHDPAFWLRRAAATFTPT